MSFAHEAPFRPANARPRPTRKSVFAHEDPFRLRTRGPSSAKKRLRTRRPISSANARPVRREKASSHTKTHFVCKRAQSAEETCLSHTKPRFALRTRGPFCERFEELFDESSDGVNSDPNTRQFCRFCARKS